MRERRQALGRTTAEQVAPVDVELPSGQQDSHRQAAQESQGSHNIGTPGHFISLRAARACAMVTPSAYSRSPPTGSPRAIRDTESGKPASCLCTYRAVASPSRLGFVAMITSLTFPL